MDRHLVTLWVVLESAERQPAWLGERATCHLDEPSGPQKRAPIQMVGRPSWDACAQGGAMMGAHMPPSANFAKELDAWGWQCADE
jgi:hypothetical protein